MRYREIAKKRERERERVRGRSGIKSSGVLETSEAFANGTSSDGVRCSISPIFR